MLSVMEIFYNEFAKFGCAIIYSQADAVAFKNWLLQTRGIRTTARYRMYVGGWEIKQADPFMRANNRTQEINTLIQDAIEGLKRVTTLLAEEAREL